MSYTDVDQGLQAMGTLSALRLSVVHLRASAKLLKT